MQIAVITDIHGNNEALHEVLADIQKREVDLLICAGDIVNPLPSSNETINILRAQSIPCLRGNHEDYMISYVERSSPELMNSPHFAPTRLTAQTISAENLEFLRSSPLTHSISHPSQKNVLVCHAQPSANNRGYYRGINPELELELQATPESVIICGHWHVVGEKQWRDKQLILAGSLGLSFNPRGYAEYSLLQFHHGSWQHLPVEVPYDRQLVAEQYLNSEFFLRGGPIAWLLLDELRHASRRMGPFFPWLHHKNYNPQSLPEWQRCCQEFLQDCGSWSAIKTLIS